MDLWYPSLIIPLSSSVGQEIFSNSSHVAYDRLNTHFEGQEHLSFCGIACATILLNTLLPYQNWSQSNIYSNVARNHMSNGITLSKLSYVLEKCGLRSRIRYCEDKTIEEQFRKDLRKEKNFLIVNYLRQFKEKNKNHIHRGGHLSLIAGFNQITDHVLILDTSHTRFPHHWLSVKDLIQMMCTYDKMSSRPRGYLVITDPKQIE
ncbi:unnamed protein product [Rotaria sordida]|uniref:glutathione gamma-glutamylcysteinyltransferase n=2 Tax=Rotaria sordida TaxID=392033 RepID=A0A813U6L1_9BILA|nr:unnamed protein product [Rotaria sordida]CAF0832431.1 unnamed protein product [Rotaria sordida]CAF0889085.1 unnamed protein product [Rotaria sordida]CAF3877620.1 unnamed protein product [Rotaria sordida]